MRLTSLEIKGFKSFGDKTVIHFDKGVTAIVGPNGSGKSNVVDAMRWVLGEQKTRMLRSEKMEALVPVERHRLGIDQEPASDRECRGAQD